MINSVAVYCGHQFGTDPKFARDAAEIGELFARNKIKMVFGGGNVGLMGTVASAAINNGGEVIGITTSHVVQKQEPAHENARIEIVGGVNDRKQRMFDLSDAFLILPGGIGTLNELTDILTMQQIGETHKPIWFLNTGKYWDMMGAMFVHMQQNGFIESMDDYDITVFTTPQEVINAIRNSE
ncbi:MAG: TIGR00730 family Rossman fold protein [Rickettsiales bacterium]|jgi:uncharacterized protein (TIGR00730 family)|nr:TIGR00730 family Rossman fold protein [Rickettsiales bacterium]